MGCGAARTDPAPVSGTGLSGVATDSGVGSTTENATDDGNIRFDLETHDLPPSQGCQKVDFLFVLDRSGSMLNEQDNLKGSFPGLVAALQEKVQGRDYHIMVVDTDAFGFCSPKDAEYNGHCGEVCVEINGNLNCQPINGLCSENDHYACNPNNFDTCDETLGAGVINPAGNAASNRVCELTSGERYIDATQPNLEDAFTCIASVGLAGAESERPMDAMVAALSDGLNESGGCNQGFLRDDAILVITFLSDDPLYEDSGTPQQWKDAVVAAKGGNEDAIAVLGLGPTPPDCIGGATGAPVTSAGAHWREFVALWGDNGQWGSVCEPDYSPFFDSAAQLIGDVCGRWAG